MYHKEDCKARILCTQYRELYHPTNNLFHKHTSTAHKLDRHLAQDSRQVYIQCSLVQLDHCNEDISNDSHLNSSYPMMYLYNSHNMFNHQLCWVELLNNIHILWLNQTLSIIYLLKSKLHQLPQQHDHLKFSGICQVSNLTKL